MGRKGPAGHRLLYALDRIAERPISNLASFASILQIDGSEGYRLLPAVGTAVSTHRQSVEAMFFEQSVLPVP